MNAVAVFGSSEPLPGEPAYAEALRVGGLLATAGFRVVTGGYGGVMEAASRGAKQAGGRTLGVACEIFATRAPNAYLDEVVMAPDLCVRSRELIDRAVGYIVLQGKAGTLAELSLLWALNRAGCLDRRPVIVLGSVYGPLLDQLARSGMLEEAQLHVTRLVATPEEAVERLGALLGGFER